MSDTPPLGIIEGYYGRPWSAADRLATIADLAPLGFSFFIHAPKADPFLRRRWREDHPQAEGAALAELAAACRALGVRFGVGLSPYEIYLGFDDDARTALARKLAWLDDIGVTDLAILFDDMRGDLPDLADRQVEILHWIAERTAATRLVMCPTYYSDDPVLDRVFGDRPPGYLDRLGEALDPAIDVFWTGTEVCSREYSRRQSLAGRVPPAPPSGAVGQLSGKRRADHVALSSPARGDRTVRTGGSRPGARREPRQPADPLPHPGAHARRRLPPRARLRLWRSLAGGGARGARR